MLFFLATPGPKSFTPGATAMQEGIRPTFGILRNLEWMIRDRIPQLQKAGVCPEMLAAVKAGNPLRIAAQTEDLLNAMRWEQRHYGNFFHS
jgi:hypothetical protein